MRSALRLITIALLPIAAGCATSEEVQLRMRVAELEQIVAGKDDDLGYLMGAIAEQNGYIRQLEMGAAMQADAIAKLRDGNCEI